MPLSKKELGELIKKARQEKSKKIKKKYLQSDLANATGKSRSYIGDLETGRTYPSYPLLSKIAEACEVPLSFFQADIESALVDQLSEYPEKTINNWLEVIKETDLIKLDFLSGEEKDTFKLIGHTKKTERPALETIENAFPMNPADLFKVPILGLIRAGEPLYADENIEGYMYVDRSIARVGPDDEVFYLRIVGDSMTPKYQPGDLVLIRKQSVVDDGEVAAVIIDGQDAALKKVYRNNGVVWLHSTNPNFEPFKVSVDQVSVIGKAIMRVGFAE